MLKPASWSLYGLELAYDRDVVWEDGTETHAPVLVLRLEAEDGSVGVAEVKVKPTWYGVSYKSLIGSVEEIFLPMLYGIDMADPAAFMARARRVPENQIAKALVDNALWDLGAWAATYPPAHISRPSRKVDVSWVLTRAAPRSMVAEATRMVEKHGFRTLKLKGGQGIDTDLEVVRDIRTALGESVRLYVDANWHYEADEAVDYVNRLADAGAMAAEDPCRLRPDARFSELQSGSAIPLIVDLFCASLSDAELFAERGAKALSLKPARIGLSDCLDQARLARETGILVHVGFGGESALGAIGALRLSDVLPYRDTWLPAEVSFFLMMKEQILTTPLGVEDGTVTLPDARSIASITDFEKIERLAKFKVVSGPLGQG